MALGLTLSNTIWRYDSTILVGVFPDGLADLGIVQIGDDDYIRNVINGDFEHRFRNRSSTDLLVTLRDQKVVPEWVPSGGDIYGEDTLVGPIGLGGFFSVPGGVYYDTAIDPDLCSIQARILSGGGISIQNGDVEPTHDYEDPQVAHSMRAFGGGYGEIRENGQIVPVGGRFKWTAYGELANTETMLIQVDHGVVKYYLVKADNTMILLRTTRSKLTSDPKIEVKLALEGDELDEIYYTDAEEASANIEIVGVLENFQDWNNDFLISSTGDSIMMANNEPQFTYPNPKRNVRALNANLAMRTKEQRLAFEDFFMWHGNEREFIFVDKAKTDADSNTTEFWARFASPFGDKSRNQCLSSHTAQIVESYRREYVAKDVYT